MRVYKCRCVGVSVFRGKGTVQHIFFTDTPIPSYSDTVKQEIRREDQGAL